MEPTFLKPQTNMVSPFEPIEVTIASNTSCMRGKSASFVQHIEFDLSGTPLEGTFKPGQSIGVTPPGMDVLGRPEGARLYSISSPSFGEDGAGKIVTTTCKRLIDQFDPQYGEGQVAVSGLHLGVCSNYLSSLKSGDKVLVSGPSGKKFCLPQAQDQHNYVFVATGTGIAPYRGMVKELLYGPQGPIKGEIHVVMGVPYTSDLLYDEFFREAASAFPNLHYHTVVSREHGTDGALQGYVHDYLHRNPAIGDSVLGQEETVLYMCGLKGMQVGVYQYLAAHGLEDAYLRIPKPLIGTDPIGWTALDARRIRPKSRCLVEVY